MLGKRTRTAEPPNFCRHILDIHPLFLKYIDDKSHTNLNFGMAFNIT